MRYGKVFSDTKGVVRDQGVVTTKSQGPLADLKNSRLETNPGSGYPVFSESDFFSLQDCHVETGFSVEVETKRTVR